VKVFLLIELDSFERSKLNRRVDISNRLVKKQAKRVASSESDSFSSAFRLKNADRDLSPLGKTTIQELDFSVRF
jgi:hypothetical protein